VLGYIVRRTRSPPFSSPSTSHRAPPSVGKPGVGGDAVSPSFRDIPRGRSRRNNRAWGWKACTVFLAIGHQHRQNCHVDTSRDPLQVIQFILFVDLLLTLQCRYDGSPFATKISYVLNLKGIAHKTVRPSHPISLHMLMSVNRLMCVAVLRVRK
jgi:hypothetical protein